MIRSTSPQGCLLGEDSVSSWLRCWISLKEPHVLDGDHGLIGKVFRRATCLSEKG